MTEHKTVFPALKQGFFHQIITLHPPPNPPCWINSPITTLGILILNYGNTEHVCIYVHQQPNVMSGLRVPKYTVAPMANNADNINPSSAALQ